MKSKTTIKLLLISLIFIFSGCKINQTKNKEREGKWIYTDNINEVRYQSKGKYKKGVEIKTWRHFANNRLVKKEKYKKGICHVTSYHPNGKIASIGQTKMIETKEDVHWFYFGDWKFFDKNGKATFLKKYENGELISEQEIQ
jgi:ribosomal protein L31